METEERSFAETRAEFRRILSEGRDGWLHLSPPQRFRYLLGLAEVRRLLSAAAGGRLWYRKDGSVSAGRREAGNRSVKEGKVLEALELYNQAILHAPFPTQVYIYKYIHINCIFRGRMFFSTGFHS